MYEFTESVFAMSAASFLLNGVHNEGGLGKLEMMLSMAGEDVLAQGLPLRGWSFLEIQRVAIREPNFFVSLENAWNTGSAKQAFLTTANDVLRKLVRKDLLVRNRRNVDLPTLFDLYFFGRKAAVSIRMNTLWKWFPRAIPVESRIFDPATYVEPQFFTNVPCGFDETQVGLYAVEHFPGKIVFDTHHVPEKGDRGQPAVATNALGFLQMLLEKGKLGMVHLQPSGRSLQDLQAFLRHDPENLMISTLKVLRDYQWVGPVVFEIMPKVFYRRSELECSQMVRQLVDVAKITMLGKS